MSHTEAALIDRFVGDWRQSPFGKVTGAAWEIVSRAESLVREAMTALPSQCYRRQGDVAIHRSATIEPGVVLKGSIIIGPRCLVSAGAYLRGGVYLSEENVVGPGSEVKSSIVFPRSKIAHLSFVGDCILGSDVNIESGAVLANHRNEMDDKVIRILHAGEVIDTGVTKFGSLIGDRARIGANAVIAPGGAIGP